MVSDYTPEPPGILNTHTLTLTPKRPEREQRGGQGIHEYHLTSGQAIEEDTHLRPHVRLSR